MISIKDFPANSIIENKYFKWYLQICRYHFSVSYTEKHHIVPRSFGGSDENKNLVNLSARAHFIAHLLLVKCTQNSYKRKAAYAVRFMLSGCKNHARECKIFSRHFSLIKETLANKRKFFAWSPENKKFSGDNVKLFCTNENLISCTVSNSFKLNLPKVSTAGKFKGWVFAAEDYSIEEVIKLRDEQLDIAKKNRNKARKEIWLKDKNKRILGGGKQVSLLLKDPENNLHKFSSLAELRAKIPKPCTSMQNVKLNLPYTFLKGAWSGWTLIEYK